MIGKLKMLLLAAAAMMALSAVAASGAQAETLFHSHNTNTVIKITQDGEGKTAHQVFDAGPNGSITCKGVHAKATTSELTVNKITLEGIEYTECSFLGSPTTVKMNGCDYLITSTGGGKTVVGGIETETGVVHVVCPGAATIEFGPAACTIHVGSQTVNMIHFHNIGVTASNTTEITVEPAPAAVKYNAVGASCSAPGEGTGENTTANTIATGEVDPSGAMVPIWWA